MKKTKNSYLLVVAAILLVGIGFVQTGIDPIYPQFLPKRQVLTKGEVKETNLMLELPQQFLGLAVAGFREMAAGLLWVRADEFFHTGNYKAVMPVIRLTTWLDPHQIDVYSTGAWHLDFNFTDSYERSDRRYIPSAIALLKEGIANNPRNYDLYFELAWTHYNLKAKDPIRAVEWAEKAAQLPAIDANTGKEVDRPAFVDRMLAHLYEKAGMLDDADRQWRKTILKYKEKVDKKADDYMSALDVEVAERNYKLFLMRRAWREKDVNPPVDVDFEVKVKRLKPKVLSITGKANLVAASEYKNLVSEEETNYWRDKPATELWRDGARVTIMLTDLDYKPAEVTTFSWDVDDSVTVLVDDVRISKGEFSAVIDMGSDPHMYGFKADKYKLTLIFNPQHAPDFIQDRLGWRGEGMTDKNYLDKSTIPGYNVIKWEKVYDRKELI